MKQNPPSVKLRMSTNFSTPQDSGSAALTRSVVDPTLKHYSVSMGWTGGEAH